MEKTWGGTREEVVMDVLLKVKNKDAKDLAEFDYASVKRLERSGFRVTYLEPAKDGRLSADDVRNAIVTALGSSSASGEPWVTKSVDPPWFVTNTIELGGFSRLSKASNSWFGTNSFGVKPIDHDGNWQSYAIAGAGQNPGVVETSRCVHSEPSHVHVSSDGPSCPYPPNNPAWDNDFESIMALWKTGSKADWRGHVFGGCTASGRDRKPRNRFQLRYSDRIVAPYGHGWQGEYVADVEWTVDFKRVAKRYKVPRCSSIR